MSHPNNLYVIKASAGTGKTYTLAAHYIALLMNGESYKNILAVTFTNKATAEMKERIVTYLHAIAREPHIEEVVKFINKVREVSKQRGLNVYTDEQYTRMAEQLLNTILADFDNMKIQTIDSFLQTLLSGVVQVLGQSMGYAVELDINQTISTAIDQLLSEDVTTSTDVKDTVVYCINERLKNEEKWDLRPKLIQLVKRMYQEDIQQLHQQIIFPNTEHPDYAKRLISYKQKLDWRKCDTYLQIVHLYEQVKDYKQQDVIPQGKIYYDFINRVNNSIQASCKEDDMFRGLKDPSFSKFDTKFKGREAEGAAIQAQLLSLHELCNKMRPVYLSCTYRKEHIDDLMLVGYVIKRIKQNLRESNTILLAETAYKLAHAMGKGDADFILYKAGIRYKHIMLDEFQDTSTLQWDNFKRLVIELISQDGSALIVGDVKQSIYRWRNGDYQIMATLDRDPDISSHYTQQPLTRNFRSRETIIRFVNETFAKKAIETPEQTALYQEVLSEYNNDCNHPATGTDGYVGLWSFVSPDNKAESNEATRQELLTKMFQHMEQLLAGGYQPQDMLILVRGTSEAQKVIDSFNLIIHDERFPHLAAAGKIISRDSFRYDYSVGVNVIVNALKALYLADDVAREYVRLNADGSRVDEVLNQLDTQAPLNDVVEQIIARLLCQDGHYPGSDLAHLNGFRDALRTFVGKHGSDTQAFLTYWDDTLHTKSIQSAEGVDIRLMTIHSAKGLQAKNVFIPFCNWPMEDNGNKGNTIWCAAQDLQTDDGQAAFLPISDKKGMKETEFMQEYQSEHAKQRIDNLNLLYVALTRPEDNLFIYVYGRDSQNVGGLLTQTYGEEMDGYNGSVMHLPQPTQTTSATRKSEPFSFAGADVPQQQADYNGSHAQILFRQSKQSMDMILAGTHSEADNRARGILCHDIMAHIETKQDVEHVIDTYFQMGTIPNQEQRNKIRDQILQLVHHPIASTWFDGSWNLLREDTVLVPTADGVVEKRMDRVMYRDNEAIVLDYKFGEMEKDYRKQVRDYMRIMRQMGYNTVRGYLWIAATHQLIEVAD